MADQTWFPNLLTFHQRVRRTLLLRRRLLAAVCAGVAMLFAVQAAAAPPPATVEVLTAARDLPSGAVLTRADLVVAEFAAGTAPARAPAYDEAVGRTLAAPLGAGEPVTDLRLVGPSLLDGYPGLAAVPVRIPDPDVVALLEVGDRIDLVATDPRGAAGATVIAEDVPVLAMPQPSAEAGVAAAGAGLGGRLLVIGTTPGDSEKVAHHAVQDFLSIRLSG
jgi:Flp pilus assembly protein CpaB